MLSSVVLSKHKNQDDKCWVTVEVNMALRFGNCFLLSRSCHRPFMRRFGRKAWQARRLTLRRLADQVIKEGGTAISPQYLFDIEVHHRVPSPHVLRELARVLEVDYDMLLASTGAADTIVREYLQSHPSAAESVIKLFRAAQQREFEDWERLRLIIKRSEKARKR